MPKGKGYGTPVKMPTSKPFSGTKLQGVSKGAGVPTAKETAHQTRPHERERPWPVNK